MEDLVDFASIRDEFEDMIREGIKKGPCSETTDERSDTQIGCENENLGRSLPDWLGVEWRIWASGVPVGIVEESPEDPENN